MNWPKMAPASSTLWMPSINISTATRLFMGFELFLYCLTFSKIAMFHRACPFFPLMGQARGCHCLPFAFRHSTSLPHPNLAFFSSHPLRHNPRLVFPISFQGQRSVIGPKNLGPQISGDFFFFPRADIFLFRLAFSVCCFFFPGLPPSNVALVMSSQVEGQFRLYFLLSQ